MMRVALFSLHSSPLADVGQGNAGGMNVYVRRLAIGLAAQGIDVDMFTRRTDLRSPDVIDLPAGPRLIQLRAGPARQVPKSVLPLHIPAMVEDFRRFQRDEGIRYDVIHSHYWLSGLAAVRAREGDTPIVHMFHTLSRVKEFYTGRPDPTDSALRADGERCVVAAADAIVGSIDVEREQIERLYGRAPARYEIIPPGVDLSHFRPHDPAFSRRVLGLKGDRIILFVGRLDRIKGVDLLLQAIAEIAPVSAEDIRAVILGHDEGARRALGAYQRLAHKLGIEKYVDFRGVIPQTELPLYYSAADVLAMPSAYESFGMAAAESMACETPVVGFRVGGLAALIEGGRTGFLAAPGDHRDYVTRLHAALWHDDLPAMGRAARRAVSGFDWDAVTERTVDLYRDLLRSRIPLRVSSR
ncbi:MAG TPA: glycosyltransferase [Chloroflexota bacterium]|nr:glycosyltransferase [Chloroflexota bacterium]